MKHLCLFVVLLAVPSAAQFTTVTGTVIDPNTIPYANGTITATLNTTASPTLNGFAYQPPTQPVGLNTAGTFLMQLADNTVLLPGGTTWTFKVCSAAGTVQPAGGKGPICFTVSSLVIAGASQDISAQLTAAALALTFGGGGGALPTDATGKWLNANGVGNPPTFQTKALVDIRDKTSCGSVDDTAAVTALLGTIGAAKAGIWLSCQIKLSNITLPSNVTIDPAAGGSIFVQTGQTVTIRGPINYVPQQIFFNVGAGQGTTSFSGNRLLTRISPVWWGLDCTGTNDNSPVWTQIVAFTGDNSTFIIPQNCVDKHASQVDVPSRAGFKLTTETRAQNGGGNVQRPQMIWTGTTGVMWNFIANQTPTVEGIAFSNTNTTHTDKFLNFDGNPSTYIGTEATIQYNTFTNNMVNPTIGGAGTFDALAINTVSGQNHEKNVITDNDFFCSQSAAFRESNSTVLTSGSQNVSCGLLNCHYTTHAVVGERVRISYATGILDTTIQSITDDNNLVTVAAATSNQTNARITFGQAYGNGITIGSVNSKHNTISRNGFTQCERGLNVVNGSFSGEHFGGSANDTLLYLNNLSEPSEAAYVEDESTMRDVFLGASMDAPITLSHLRNSLGISGEYDGFIYFSGGGSAIITSSVVQDTPATNQIVIGAAAPQNFQLTSIGNRWSPGVITMSNLGFTQWRTFAEGAATGVGSGVLISCGDYFGASDAPGTCFQFGDGGVFSGTNEGHITVSSSRFGNFSSFSVFTAEPNVQVNTFVNDAIGYKTNFLAFNNSTTMNFVGFDAAFKQTTRAGNGIGFRYTMPNVDTSATAMPASYGLWVRTPTANTKITTANGVRVEDLAAVTGITNRYSFFGVGATDIAHFGGPTETLGPLTFTADNTTDIGATGATRPRDFYLGRQFFSQVTTGTAPFVVTSTTPVGTLTVSNHPTLQDCGATSTCANTQKTSALIVRGSVAFPTATTVTVTSLPFTGAANYSCTASDLTTAAGVINATTYTSGSSVTFTETNGVNTDTMRYICAGF